MIKTWLRKQAAIYLIEKAKTPIGKESMQFAGVDHEGRKYYTWPELKNIPTCRLQEIEALGYFADAAINKENLQSLARSIQQVNQELIAEKTEKNKPILHARISALADELMFRNDYIIPKSITCQIAAVIFVREDEPSEKYVQHIQDEKAATFEKMVNDGAAFFFDTPIMKTVLSSYIGQDVKLQTLSLLWTRDKENQLRRMEVIMSGKGSGSTSKTRPN